LLIRHTKYSAILSKTHCYRLLFRRFCALGPLRCYYLSSLYFHFRSKRTQRKGSMFSEDTLIVTNTTLNVLRSFGMNHVYLMVSEPNYCSSSLCSL